MTEQSCGPIQPTATLFSILPSKKCNGNLHGVLRSMKTTSLWATSTPFGCRAKIQGPKSYGVFAHRNPGKYKLRNDGGSEYRSAERRLFGLLFQEPPRITLYPPIGGPVGFCDGLVL